MFLVGFVLCFNCVVLYLTNDYLKNMTDQGYLKRQSDNLPKVDSIMVAEFCSKSDVFSVAEIRGVKANRCGF